jgi:RNA polymerase sigma-70 factor, ECF subfamily
VIRLRMEGYEVAEISKMTGRSKRSVERNLQDGRKRLDALLER